MSSVDEATQTQLRNIEAQTGHSLDELIAAAEDLSLIHIFSVLRETWI